MPKIQESLYVAPWFIKGRPHLQTILPSLIRRIYPAFYKRQRIELADSDFLDIDWVIRSKNKKKRVVLICHGLEGSSRAPYTKGMCRIFAREGWDVCLMNFRSCSGELNRLAKSYHSGETSDLSIVIEQIEKAYEKIALVGFSLGGNAVLKYLGENADEVPSKVGGAVVISVPCELSSSGEAISKPENRFYLSRFLRKLEKKVRKKHMRGDWISSPDGIKEMSSFWHFDQAFTAPLHGFKNADDYYLQSSSKQFVESIKVPTLLINALNDPFLSPACFPIKEAEASQYFSLEAPLEGGHCGFPTGMLLGPQWHEERALAFLQQK